MLKFILSMYVPMLLCGLVGFAEEGGGEGDAGGAAGGEGDPGGTGETVDNGSTVSRDLTHDEQISSSRKAAEKPWYEGLVSDPAVLTDKDREYKSFDEYVKGAQNARQLAAAKGIPIPGKDATDEQKAAFRAEVLKHFPDLPLAPESADGYELEMFKDSELGEERQTAIKTSFHKAGLSNAHAGAVMDIYAEQVAQDMQEAQAQIEATRKATDAELKKEWGPEYDERTAGIQTVEKRYAGFVEKAKAYGLDADIDFRHMLDDVARSTAEDNPGGGGSGGESVDEQIKTVRASDEYRNGNALTRQRVIKEKLEPLYKKREQMRKK